MPKRLKERYRDEREEQPEQWRERIRLELRAVAKARKAKPDERALFGAEQALGWAMGANYMAASKAFA